VVALKDRDFLAAVSFLSYRIKRRKPQYKRGVDESATAVRIHARAAELGAPASFPPGAALETAFVALEMAVSASGKLSDTSLLEAFDTFVGDLDSAQRAADAESSISMLGERIGDVEKQVADMPGLVEREVERKLAQQPGAAEAAVLPNLCADATTSHAPRFICPEPVRLVFDTPATADLELQPPPPQPLSAAGDDANQQPAVDVHAGEVADASETDGDAYIAAERSGSEASSEPEVGTTSAPATSRPALEPLAPNAVRSSHASDVAAEDAETAQLRGQAKEGGVARAAQGQAEAEAKAPPPQHLDELACAVPRAVEVAAAVPPPSAVQPLPLPADLLEVILLEVISSLRGELAAAQAAEAKASVTRAEAEADANSVRQDLEAFYNDFEREASRIDQENESLKEEIALFREQQQLWDEATSVGMFINDMRAASLRRVAPPPFPPLDSDE